MSTVPKPKVQAIAPTQFSIEDMKWLAMSVYWHIVLQHPMTGEANLFIEKIRSDAAMTAEFKQALAALKAEEGLDSGASDRIYDFVSTPSR